MHSVNMRCEKLQVSGLAARAALRLVLMIVTCAGLSVAQKPNQETFPSPTAASRSLFLAVQSGNEQAMIQILGARKELISCGNELDDKSDRDRFVQKYQEMHRLVREPDGATFVVIGAENWPFPIPLVSKAGVWYFDADGGSWEVLFRRIGENEATAIEESHALVRASKTQDSAPTGDDPVSQYARTVVNSPAANNGKTSANGEEAATPFHGYYFRMLTGQPKASGAPEKTTSGVAFVAYPVEYRSSGVLTFVITPDNIVYKADLGPNTVKIAKAMTTWKRTPKWHVAE